MDTARSDFKSALDYFWNNRASAQEDLVLIVCGSAASWIITNLLTDKKGFHNRVTRRIHLAPFSLSECEQLFALNDVVMTRKQMIESYIKDAIHVTLICGNGYKRSKYSEIAQNVIVGDDLFT